MNIIHNDYIDNVFNGNYAKIYGLMIESIENAGNCSQLASLYQQINNSGQSLALPLAENQEIVRTFIRIGVLKERSQSEYNKTVLDYIVNSFAKEADRSPALVSVIIRLFSSGQYGIVPTPVCGSSPKCSKCKLTKFCQFFNSPPLDPAKAGLSIAKRFELGAENSVTNIELISVLVGGNKPSSSSKHVAENVMSRYSTLRSLSNVSLSELKNMRNVSDSAAFKIYSALILFKRFVEEENLDKIIIKESKDLFDLFKVELRDQKQESFFIVMLDSMNGIIRQKKIAHGGLSSVQVISSEVFRPALIESAVSVVLVHNHPSGNPKPSDDDIRLTKDLAKAGELLGIEVVDHIIIGDNRYISFVDNNIVPFKRSKGINRK